MGKAKRPKATAKPTAPAPESEAKSGRPGRPSALTPEVATIILEALLMNAYRETAALKAGIDRTTLWRWMKRGEEETEGDYFEFCNAVKEAEAVAEAAALQVITGAGAAEWQALAWVLERKYPDRYGKRARAELPPTEPVAPVKTSAADMLSTAQRALAQMLGRLETLATSGQGLTETQLAAAGDMARTLATLAKEERELAKAGAGAALSDADLATQVLGALSDDALAAEQARRKAGAA